MRHRPSYLAARTECTRKGRPHPQHTESGSFHRTCQTEPATTTFIIPWNRRGWWDYGTGALGDMACHILHQPFRALKLGYPTKVEGSSTLLLSACAPQAQHVKMIFPARDNMPKVALPEVEVHRYDGGMMPERPKGFPEGKQLMGPGGGLTIFHGTKDTLICGCYGEQPFLLSGRVPNAPKVCRRVTCSHEMDWVRAVRKTNPTA